MRKFVHLSILLLVLSLAMTAVGPVLAQEPAAAEEADAEAVSHEAEAEAEEEGAETHSPDSSGHAPGATDNTPIALLLTGMIILFAVGAVAIRRL